MEDGTLMQAVILAGGLGTRIRSALPEGTPKAMAPINGRPFLEFVLDQLASQGVTEYLLLTGYAAESIRNHFGHSFYDRPVHYSHETSPLGTGGAVSNALLHLRDEFILLNGDTFAVANFSELLQTLTTKSLGMTLASVQDVGRFGSARTEGGSVTNLIEKGRSGPGLINAGVYAVRRTLIESITQAVWSFENDLLSVRLGELLPNYIVAEGPFFDIGVPSDYAAATTYFSSIKKSN